MKRIPIVLAGAMLRVGYLSMTVFSLIFLTVNRGIISGFPIVCLLTAVVPALPP